MIVYHYLVRFTSPLNTTDLHGYHRTFPLSVEAGRYGVEAGRYGVEAVFVIRGMVIIMTLERSATVIAFFQRRFARLFPALLACALVTFTLMRLFGPVSRQVGVVDLLASITLLPENLRRPFVDGTYWSLVVEVQLYVWAGLAWWLLGRRFWIGMIALAVSGTVTDHRTPPSPNDS